MSVRQTMKIPEKVRKTMAQFTAVLVDEAEVVEPSRRGREAKPMLADDFESLIFGTPVVRTVDGKQQKFENIKAAIEVGQKSDWLLVGEASEVKIRSAAKYHGLAVSFGKTKAGQDIFRFSGVFTPRPRKTDEAKATAKK